MGCQAALGKFLRSLKTDSSIQHQVLAVTADIEESRVKSVIDDDDELREAEMRFGIVDSIIKGIVRCSGAALAAEETVAAREEDFLPDYSSTFGTPTASSSLTNAVTPGFQRTVSKDIKPDYTVFSLRRHTETMAYLVAAIVEVKREWLFNDRAVCQTIGYHIASHIAHTCTSVRTAKVPPLAVLICGTRLYSFS